jgi:hypothetical protein
MTRAAKSRVRPMLRPPDQGIDDARYSREEYLSYVGKQGNEKHDQRVLDSRTQHLTERVIVRLV